MTTITWSLSMDMDSLSFGIGSPTTTSQLNNSSTQSTTLSTTTSSIATFSSTPTERRTSQTTTSSSVPYPTSSASSQSSSGLSTGQTVGIIVGIVCGSCLLMCLIFFYCWRRKSRRIANQKPHPANNDEGKHPTTGSPPRNTFRMSAPPRLPNAPPSRRRSLWPRSIHPDEIGVAVIPTERQGFINRITNPGHRTKPTLPISAPIPEDRVSVQHSFRDRFFAPPPPPIPPSAEGGSKHVSDATTIRTSGNPPTPNRPAIALLRPWSTTPSVETPLEDDARYRTDEVPPVPTFTAVEVPMRALTVRRQQNGPPRLDLEAGIKKSINKALSTIPTAPRYDNGRLGSPAKPTVPSKSQPHLRTPNGKETPKTYVASGMTAKASSEIVYSEGPTTITPTPQLPRSPYSDVPERSSSSTAVTHGDEEWLLQNKNITPTPAAKSRTLRRARSPARRMSDSSLASPVRNLSYPRIPVSASEERLSIEKPTPKLSRKAQIMYQSSPPTNIERYSNKPLPRVFDPGDPFEGPSNNNHIARQFQPPARIYIPPAARAPLQRSPSSSFSDLTTSKAVLTPNRTTTGDLVLTVDM